MMVDLETVFLRDPGCVLPQGFWAAVTVWLEKPHVLNKRLCGSTTQWRWEVSPAVPAESQTGPGEKEEPEGLGGVLGALSGISSPGQDGGMLDKIRGYGERAAASGTTITLRTLIPKANPHYPSVHPRREAVIQDIPNRLVTFIPLEEPNYGHFQVKKNNIYQIRLAHVKDDEWSITLSTLCPESWASDGVVYPKICWMRNELLSKLAKWSTEDKKSEFKSTLSLIAVDKYSTLYQRLKEKYKEMVKVWPEVTDPEKFVYEDVAIATYLLILWEEERLQKNLCEKQSFVDLGCGNGLLVHILSREGHRGRGIDVRKRKIWDMYGSETILEECAIKPSDEYLFPDTDWIIGNHSDELTPWIPVIAARSSYSCSYFVLPCCFFNFYGKYNRKSCKKTQYREYLDFVTEVGHHCGFNVEEDCLRIPSTKRVCLIGKSRTYLHSQEAMIDEQRKEYIKTQYCDPLDSSNKPSPCVTEMKDLSGHHDGLTDVADGHESSNSLKDSPEKEHGHWISNFQPREKVEQIRNCALLPRDFIDKVVLHVATLLLKEEKSENVVETNTPSWNKGGCLLLREVAEDLGKETLQKLKKECGGLQTLLRNNHQVFEVINSKVSIRDWRKEAQTATNKRREETKRTLSPEVLKTRLCWFYVNHPNSCPRTAESCPYAHGMEELRPSSTTQRKKLRQK
ncbi:probable tRNA (uracil-O(2)-)-methyltransferase [Pelobates fuscus]|uniref:probable tRNA (uracil-O(2)-)-methyltransferase n=1 Tax=Pelobates fuscus TaxID=191477 RepID=UPI002FE45F6E